MIDSFVEFFSDYRLLLLIIHILGTVLGMGGALISDILFFRFLSDGKITRKEAEVLHIMKSVVLLSLLVILLSGAAMIVPHPQRYIGSAPFLIKMTIVIVLTLNGIALHVFVAPFLLRMNLLRPSKEHAVWRHIAFGLGGISMVSWLSAFLTAMTKEHFTWSYPSLAGGYFLLLAATVAGTQAVEYRLSRQHRRKR